MAETLTNIAVEVVRNYNGLKGKVQNLKRKIERLSSQAADVIAMLREAELHSGKKRKREVGDWLTIVENKKKEFESLEKEVNESGFYKRIQMAKYVDKMIEEVAELVELGTFSEGLVLDVHEPKGEPLVTTEWKGQTFEVNLQEILVGLRDDNVLVIGIYGMGGVGKTTLAMRIHNDLLTESMFLGNVYWVTVSMEFSIHKLQNDIAKTLDVDLSKEDDEKKRAAKLSLAFGRMKKFVLILDNVWNSIAAEKIGISPEMDGFKLIITSRSLEICRTMKCQKNIKVEPLLEEDAWKLFTEKLGYGIKLPSETEDIAKKVAKRCAGLPLGIITMAGSMRGVTDIHEWRNALEELKESSMERDNMENEVLPILQCSFNRLRDQKLQRCFLYCSLYPEGHRIPRYRLIAKFISEELMDKRKNRQAEFDQGHAILNKLENVCLLEGAENYQKERYVKMHDLIRDMAIRITKDSPKYMVKSGLQLKVIPEEQDWKEDLDKVSLMQNEISKISPGISPNCPQLSTLVLRDNPLRLILDSFFLCMHGLQILDLSYIEIEKLPSSISDLKNLSSLLLRGCIKLTSVPPLGKLKALRELDLTETKIKELPQGMESLDNLKRLDLLSISLGMIPTGILSRFSNLQRLMLPYHIKVPVKELEGLKHLEEFQGALRDVCDFNQFIKSQKSNGQVRFYNIYVGPGESNGDFCEDLEKLSDKRVILRRCTLNKRKRKRERKREAVLLSRDIQHLEIDKCNNLSSCFLDDFAWFNNPRNLKTCEIFCCKEIEFILRLSSYKELMAGGKHGSRRVPFQRLEYLHLSDLPNFISMIKREPGVAAVPPGGMFSCLKKLDIKYCDQIEKLFPLGFLHNLCNLERLYVFSCEKMVEIIAHDEEEGMDVTSTITIPRLKHLSLNDLPELKMICKTTMTCNSMESIDLWGCIKLKKLPFFQPTIDGEPYAPSTLKVIEICKEDKEWWESMEWEHPNARNIIQPFVKFY
ncbi:Disease resistance protein [Forsythia ovata]|uniref:Disease resistance protein n=1 Tax=Forsythia ovata TaxID=205694 RepID=A0ABD1Q9Z0_9LAMI